jgi:hypothetical protein
MESGDEDGLAAADREGNWIATQSVGNLLRRFCPSPGRDNQSVVGDGDPVRVVAQI